MYIPFIYKRDPVNPKIDEKSKNRRFLRSVTRPSPKTSKIKSTMLENVDGRRSRIGWRAVWTLCRFFSSSCCWNEMKNIFHEGWRKCGGVCCVQSELNEGFRRFADVSRGKNPWSFWILENFSHKTAWQRSCPKQVCQTHFPVRPSAHNQHYESINWNYFEQDEMRRCVHPPPATSPQQTSCLRGKPALLAQIQS